MQLCDGIIVRYVIVTCVPGGCLKKTGNFPSASAVEVHINIYISLATCACRVKIK